MATFYLVNIVSLGTVKILPGDLIDDAKIDPATIVAAGGVLWPSADPIVAAAAAEVQAAHTNKGMNETDMMSFMTAATEKSLKAEVGSGTVSSTVAVNNSGTTGVTAAGLSHTHTSGTTSFPCQASYHLPASSGVDFSAATVIGTGQPVTPSAQPDYPRNLRVLTTNTWATNATVVVTVTGTDMHGVSGVTEAITIPANNGVNTVDGSRAFATITNFTFTTPAGWTAGSFKLQSGPALGLLSPLGSTLGVYKEASGVNNATPQDQTLGTLDISNGTYVPSTALNGNTNVFVCYTANVAASATGGSTVTVTVTDGGHTHTQVGHTHTLS